MDKQSEYDFNKQFKNIGIDHEQVLNAGKKPSVSESEQDESSMESRDQTQLNDPQFQQEIATLRRKIDYLTNTLFPSVNDALKQMDQKIDSKVTDVNPLKKEIVALKNQISDMKKQMNNARIVFDGSAAMPTTASGSGGSVSAGLGESQSSGSNAEATDGKTPGNININKIFDYSNKKFD